MDGRKRLRQWLTLSCLTQRKAADLVGVHFTHLSQILSGRRRPGLNNAVAIERATGIPVEAWTPTGVGKRNLPVLVGGAKRRIGKA